MKLNTSYLLSRTSDFSINEIKFQFSAWSGRLIKFCKTLGKIAIIGIVATIILCELARYLTKKEQEPDLAKENEGQQEKALKEKTSPLNLDQQIQQIKFSLKEKPEKLLIDLYSLPELTKIAIFASENKCENFEQFFSLLLNSISWKTDRADWIISLINACGPNPEILHAIFSYDEFNLSFIFGHWDFYRKDLIKIMSKEQVECFIEKLISLPDEKSNNGEWSVKVEQISKFLINSCNEQLLGYFNDTLKKLSPQICHEVLKYYVKHGTNNNFMENFLKFFMINSSENNHHIEILIDAFDTFCLTPDDKKQDEQILLELGKSFANKFFKVDEIPSFFSSCKKLCPKFKPYVLQCLILGFLKGIIVENQDKAKIVATYKSFWIIKKSLFDPHPEFCLPLWLGVKTDNLFFYVIESLVDCPDEDFIKEVLTQLLTSGKITYDAYLIENIPDQKIKDMAIKITNPP